MTIADDIQSSEPSMPRLSLIHTTSVGAFRHICRSGALELRNCPVMGANLVYLFYGRPAYRPGPLPIHQTNRDRDARPVCLLFNMAVDAPDATFPCDTGAHSGGRYTPHLDGISFDDLNCTRVVLADQRIVARFFGSNDQYFYGTAKPVLDPPASNKVSQAFHSLLVSDEPRPHDDRCLSIEIQRSQAVPLDTALSAILVPDFLFDDPEVHAALESWNTSGIRVQSYRAQAITNAALTVERLFPFVATLQGLPT